MAAQQQKGPGPITGLPSSCLLIKNMFDPAKETEKDWDLDIRDDTEDECNKFGRVKHCAVDKTSAGHCFVAFDTPAAASAAAKSLHGRWFSQRMIQVEFLAAEAYNMMYPGKA